MSLVQQFVFYNLLPAVAAGLLVWLFVLLVIRIFHIDQGALRLTLLYAPLVKSTLILLGFGLIMSWPYGFWSEIQDRAVPFHLVLPVLLVWLGLVLVIRQIAVNKMQNRLLGKIKDSEPALTRLEHSMNRVISAYQDCRGVLVGEGVICCLNTKSPNPSLYVSDESLNSPLIIMNGERPIILFPKALMDELTDDELDGALAHEYAHFQLRNPACCSSEGIKLISPISPVARLLTSQLAKEEEKACDDMAILAIGKPDVYAEMLLKSYRYSKNAQNPFSHILQTIPRLIGIKPTLYERIERLVNPKYLKTDRRLQNALACLSWFCLIAIFGI